MVRRVRVTDIRLKEVSVRGASSVFNVRFKEAVVVKAEKPIKILYLHDMKMSASQI